MAEPTKVKKALSKREEKRLKWWKEKQKQDEAKGDEEEEAAADKTPSKKMKKNSKKSEKTESCHGDSVEANDATLSPTSAEEQSSKKGSSKNKSKKKGYVVFVGNLPYDATKEIIAEHFKRTGTLKDVRLLTSKETGKSRGCAYVELNDVQTHLRALRMHHSQLMGRKINVEFTSAGRKTEMRTAKLKAKNLARMKFRMAPGSFHDKLLVHTDKGRSTKKKT